MSLPGSSDTTPQPIAVDFGVSWKCVQLQSLDVQSPKINFAKEAFVSVCENLKSACQSDWEWMPFLAAFNYIEQDLCFV